MDKAIPEILKLHLMVLCSSREILSLKYKENLPTYQFITVDRMSLHPPQPVQIFQMAFKWLSIIFVTL
jgi:hypothetical protein